MYSPHLGGFCNTFTTKEPILNKGGKYMCFFYHKTICCRYEKPVCIPTYNVGTRKNYYSREKNPRSHAPAWEWNLIKSLAVAVFSFPRSCVGMHTSFTHDTNLNIVMNNILAYQPYQSRTTFNNPVSPK